MQFDPNLTLTGYGVTLRRLTHKRIEMVRQWRNDPKISQYMLTHDYITPEMQEKWFQKVSQSETAFYFIIEYQGEPVGLIDIRDVDYEKKTGEPGMYIYNDEYLNSDVGLRAGFCFGQFLWGMLKLDSCYIFVLDNNKRAIDFNVLQGYERVGDYVGENVHKYVITRERALNPSPKMQRIKKILTKTI